MVFRQEMGINKFSLFQKKRFIFSVYIIMDSKPYGITFHKSISKWIINQFCFIVVALESTMDSLSFVMHRGFYQSHLFKEI
jgi:hypothetical protein